MAIACRILKQGLTGPARIGVALSIVLTASPLCAELTLVDLHFRTSFDRVDLPGGETMGLLGTSLLIDRKQNERFAFYSGLGIYSALSGDRGGFFTGGLDSGASLRFADWRFGGGLFVGAGGGAAAPQGGGLMLRPHLSVLRDFQKLRGGLFFSQVKFPNGGIDSRQLGVQIEMPFRMLRADALSPDIADTDLEFKRVDIAPTLQRYRPGSGVKQRDGGVPAEEMILIGIEVGGMIDEQWIVFGEAGGALKGESDGYAELLSGLAFRHRLSKRFSLFARAALGGGGGGNVDTAGGLLYKVTGGASFDASPRVMIGLHYGSVNAMRGGFKAEMLKAGLAYRIDLVSPSPHRNRLSPESLRLGQWTFRSTLLRYLSSNRLRKSDANDDAVDLFVMKLDRALTEWVYLTGQAGAAFNGSAGGYATGLFGIGIKTHLTKDFSLLAEALAGAGGGGGIAADGGSIVQPMVGGSYRLSENVDLQMWMGQVIALRGRLEATVVEAGLAYAFNTLELRN